ncbi:peptidoglycan-binding domain-containing protein [Aerosakkonema funiforme]|uniref:Peptidoglycan-binding protein n=1 Tax=Aerosakkonema funiforme FACHB-1375 TaxID=2949571 RepID=A0A926ZIX6_9CYAN|nr:peptidoglycan-binding domain-containing protein [Aerosakkonema funiforme]MBD2184074.1 peptidoglycan-binding protein [Aerosakkonema funiforme FACHB-1375]
MQATTQSATASINMPELRLGSKGEAVRFLQKLLIRYGYYTGSFDAQFGSRTKQAVENFQITYNSSPNPSTVLLIDGVVEKNTWRAISELL